MSTLKTNNIQHVDRSDPSIIISTDGGVSIAGTLTYEDVTSVDAVGIVTAREILNAQKQVHVGTGVSVKAGGINVTAGITTVQALQATTGTFSSTGEFSDNVSIVKAGGPVLELCNNTATTTMALRLHEGSAGSLVNGGGMTYDGASNKLHITCGTNLRTERITIDRDSGNIGIGLTIPTSPLEMSHATNPVIKVTSTSSSVGAGFNAQGGSSNDSQLTLSSGTTAKYTFLRDGSQSDDLRIYDSANALDIIRYRHGGYLHFGVNGAERLRIDANGKLLVGHNAAHQVAGGDSLVQVQATDSTGRISVVQHRNEAEGAPYISLGKTRGTSNGAVTVVQSGDTLGTIAFAGGDGTDVQTSAAHIVCQVDGAPGSNDMPGRLLFKTTADGASSVTTRLTINQAGNAQFTGIVTATEFIPTVSQFSHRNLVINGDMRIAQRGTSATTASAMSTVDRWFMLANGVDENPTQSQVDVASGTTPYSQGLRKAFRITNGNQTSIEAADFIGYKYVFEAQDIATSGWNYTSSSSFITLSFWIKTSVNNVSTANLRTYDASPVRSFKFDVSTTANTWKKVELKVPGNSNLVFDNNNGAGLVFHLYTYLGTTYRDNDTYTETWIDGSATNTYGNNNVTNTFWNTNDATVEITGVQLEVGSQATPFEHRSYQDELHRCKRYYQRYPEGPAADNYNCLPSAIMACNNATTAYYCPTLDPGMRATPTFSSSGNFRMNGTPSVNNVAVTAIGVYHNGSKTPFQYATVASGLTGGEAVALSVNNDGNAYIAYDAEI